MYIMIQKVAFIDILVLWFFGIFFAWIRDRNKQKPSGSCLQFAKETIMLAKQTTILSDFTLAPCFKISFDLYLNHFNNPQYHSILQFIGQFTNDINNSQQGTKCSDRFPALGAEMAANGANLRFDFCINEELISRSDPHIGKILINFGRTYNIEIGQKYDSEGRDKFIWVVQTLPYLSQWTSSKWWWHIKTFRSARRYRQH